MNQIARLMAPAMLTLASACTGFLNNISALPEDSPELTVILGTIYPASPTSSTDPPRALVQISSDVTAIIFYKDSSCTLPIGSGTEADTASLTGLSLGVTLNATTQIYAQAKNAAGKLGTCTFLTEYVHKSTPPADPVFVAILPGLTGTALSPQIQGTASNDTETVKFYSNVACTNLIGSASRDVFRSSPGGAATVPADTSTNIYAQSVDIAGNESGCVLMSAYVHDSGPPTFAFVATVPASPSNSSTTPGVRGTSSADTAVVDLYVNNPTCTGAATASGTKAQFESGGGLAVTVSGNSVSTIHAILIDATPLASACTLLTNYTHDSVAPSAPSFTSTTPASPNNSSTTPFVKGTAASDAVSVGLYSDVGCSTLLASGTKSAFEGSGIQITVSANSTTTIYARNTDAAGNLSTGCTSLTSYVHNSTAPSGPVFVSATPTSPTNSSTTPAIIGTVVAAVTKVDLYSNAGCTTQIGTGTKAQFEGAGIAATVGANQATTIYGVAEDALTNRSLCTTLTTFTNDTVAPSAPSFAAAIPASPSNTSTPALRGSSSADTVAVRIFSDVSCATELGTGSKTSWDSGGGITLASAVALNSTSTLYGKAFDLAGNGSACTSLTSYTHDSVAPTAPSFVSITPTSPSNASTAPIVVGSASSDSVTVSIYSDSGCSTTLLDSGTKSAFEGAGLTANVTANTSTTIYAKAFDAASNGSTCATLTTYVHDSNAPAAPAFTSFTPASPSSNASPAIVGTASADTVSLNLFSESGCSTQIGTGTKAGFEGSGLTVSATANATTVVYARSLDAASNASACTLMSSYTHDNVAPTIAISAPSESATDGNFDVIYTITYSGASAVTLANANVTLNTTGGASCTKAVTGSGTTTRTVTLSACTGTGTVGISIVAATATDAASNSAAAAGPSTTFSKYTTGTATKLVFRVEPTSQDAGVTFNPSVVVEVQDVSNRRVGTSTASVTLFLNVNPGATTLGGTVTQSAVAGRATFNDLSITKIGTGYYLQALSGTLANAVSQSFNITSATVNPTQLGFVGAAPKVLVGLCSGPFSLQTQDVYGNRTAQSVASPASVPIAESGAGAGLFYALTDPGCTGTAITASDVASAAADAKFFVKHPTAESMNVTATGTAYGWSNASQAVTAQAASNVWVSRFGNGIPDGRSSQTAVWTGTQMIVWGGQAEDSGSEMNTGGVYNPTTDSWTATQTTGAPTVRAGHTAVWTGTAMIVWGGYSGSYSNTGGVYNPATNSWTATQTTGAPAARAYHTAVWTGTDMVVWGGENGSGLNTGGIYNPGTNSWTATQTTGAPAARYYHTAVWTGANMIVWGGYDTSQLNTGGIYNPGTNSWTATQTTGAPAARYFHTAIWTGTSMIVWGGYGSTFFNTGGIYSPTANSWTATQTSGAVEARTNSTAIWTGSEMIVWGGSNSGGGKNTSGGRYNPVSNSWTATQTSGAPSGRIMHTAVWTGTAMIVWGGAQDSYTRFDTGGIYNPITNSWTATQAVGAPAPRSYHSAVWTGSEMIVWGGGGALSSNTGGKYNPTTDSWTATQTTGAPTTRQYQTAVWTGSAMIVWGGFSSGNLNTGGVYNPTTNSWTATQTTGAPAARYGHSAVWSGTHMVVWGGFAGARVNTGGIYNPGTNSWTATQTTGAPEARNGHTAVWTGTDMVVWGGYGASYLNTGGIYNPGTNSWTATQTTGAPAARSSHTAVWTGTEMIVWGGDSAGFLNTGGVYNPTTDSWTATQTTGAPAARYGHTAVWTGTNMVVWGGGGASHFNSGGVYNPTSNSWTATQTSSAPAPRSYHSAVWTGGEMIVWGGFNGSIYLSNGGRYRP